MKSAFKWVFVIIIVVSMPINRAFATSEAYDKEAYPKDQAMTIFTDDRLRSYRMTRVVSSQEVDAKSSTVHVPVINERSPEISGPEVFAGVILKSTATSTATISPLINGSGLLKAVTCRFDEHLIFIAVGAGVALLILVAMILALVVARKKKTSVPAPSYASWSEEGIAADQTVFIGDVNHSSPQYAIKLSNAKDPNKTWTLPLTGDLLIGRAEHCPVRLEDKSVSREQCKIMVKGEDLLVVHLGLTNKTALNGRTIDHSSPLRSGDTLKLGRVFLRVDYIQSLGTIPPETASSANQASGKTESIF